MKLTAVQIVEALRDSTLTTTEMREINEVLRMKFKRLAVTSVQKFRPGEKVSFTSKRGNIVGTVFKTNRKTVSVLAEGGVMWRVSGNLLRKFVSLAA